MHSSSDINITNNNKLHTNFNNLNNTNLTILELTALTHTDPAGKNTIRSGPITVQKHTTLPTTCGADRLPTPAKPELMLSLSSDLGEGNSCSPSYLGQGNSCSPSDLGDGGLLSLYPRVKSESRFWQEGSGPLFQHSLSSCRFGLVGWGWIGLWCFGLCWVYSLWLPPSLRAPYPWLLLPKQRLRNSTPGALGMTLYKR